MQKMNINLLTLTGGETSSWTDNLAIIISILSLVVSIAFSIITYWQNKRFKDVDLEANFFIKIYQGFLCEEIPQARASMRFLNGRLEGDRGLIKVLNNMRKNSLYFRYDDEAFYGRVTGQLQLIEDFIVNTHNEIPKEHSEEEEFSRNLTIEIQKLYRIISERYHGQGKRGK